MFWTQCEVVYRDPSSFCAYTKAWYNRSIPRIKELPRKDECCYF